MLWLIPLYSGAEDLDFSKNLVCELEYIQMCKHGDHSCRWAEVVEIDGKQTFTIDMQEKSIALFEGKALIDKEKINSISVVNEMLYLHGTNPDSKNSKSGTGWLARIEQAQGDFSAASLADTKGYLIFGSCRNQ